MMAFEEVFIWTHTFLTPVLNRGRGKPFASNLFPGKDHPVPIEWEAA
jgi:hypothetical protein